MLNCHGFSLYSHKEGFVHTTCHSRLTHPTMLATATNGTEGTWRPPSSPPSCSATMDSKFTAIVAFRGLAFIAFLNLFGMYMHLSITQLLRNGRAIDRTARWSDLQWWLLLAVCQRRCSTLPSLWAVCANKLPACDASPSSPHVSPQQTLATARQYPSPLFPRRRAGGGWRSPAVPLHRHRGVVRRDQWRCLVLLVCLLRHWRGFPGGRGSPLPVGAAGGAPLFWPSSSHTSLRLMQRSRRQWWA